MVTRRTDGRKFQYDNTFSINPLDFGWITLYQLGELCCEPGYEIPEHRQFCYELSYIISGEGIFYNDGHPINVQQGDLIYTPFNVVHRISAGCRQPLNFAYFGFDFKASDMPEKKRLAEYYKNLHCLCVKDKLEIYACIQKCIGEFYRSREYGDLMISVYIDQILALAYRNFNKPEQDMALPYEDISVGGLAYYIVRYIDRNIHQPLSVQLISKAVGYNSYYISHVFKDKMDKSLQSYIAYRKVEKSKELLKQDRYSIAQIAEKMGYSSASSYSRAFCRIEGVYPSAFLEKFKNGV